MNPSLQSDNSTSSPPPYSEHMVPRGDFNIYARHYAGTGPAFVLMHGFPHAMRNELEQVPCKLKKRGLY